MAAIDFLFPLALAALLAVAVFALRDRVLARMAFRNALRRPRQSALIVGGLLVGTAIVAGSFVASDSMEHAIVEATYDAFQEIDETVVLDGFHFFPQRVADELRQDPRLAGATEAIGSNILWDASLTNTRNDQYEPSVRLVGFDPERDRAFGAFQTSQGPTYGLDLAPDEAILHRTLADAIEARPGDTLELRFPLPQDPVLPTVQSFNGTVPAGAGGPLAYAEPMPQTHTFPVSGTTVRLTLALTWDPGAAALQDLDIELTGPDGRTYTVANGTPGDPDIPAVLNVSATVADPLPHGDWTATIHAKAAAQTPYTLTVLRFEALYDLDAFRERAAQLRDQFPDFDPSAAFQDAPTQTRTLRVAAIAETGKGPLFRLPHEHNLFLHLDVLQTWLDRPGHVNLVKVSNPGGVEEGVQETSTVLPLLRASLNETKERNPDHAAIQALEANDDKRFWLDQARNVGQTFFVFLTSVASFSVLAGLLLIVNIFTMLAEERKTELGISRAVGLRRRHLTRLFTFEGAYYALPAALLGTVAGLGLAWLLIGAFNTFGDPSRFPPIPFRVEAQSLLLAFATGILLTLGTVYLGARRVAGLNIVRAIRQLEEPELLHARRGTLAATIALGATAALAVYYAATASFGALILAPTLLTVGAALVLRRRWPRRTVYPSLAVALFAFLTYTLFAVQSYDTVEGNIFGPVRAVIMTFCVVAFLVYRETAARWLGHVLMRVPPLRAIALPAVAYPLHRKLRTGLTLAMFGVVLMVVMLFSIFGAIFTPDPERETGGYDLQAVTEEELDALPAHADAMATVTHYDTLPFFHSIGGEAVHVDNATSGQFGPPQDYLYGVDAAFAANNGFRLLHRDPAYATDADAYAAVAAQDDLAIVAYPYSTDREGNPDRHGVGSTLQVSARGGEASFRIVGVQEQVHFKGVFISRPALEGLYSNTATLFLVRLEPGADADAAATAIEAANREIGLNVESIRAQVQRENETFRQIFALIQLFLGLGLIVGILSLGIVTARSVIERRQEIGMMRALGYRRRDIRRAFLLETMALVGVGIATGFFVALVVSFGLWVAVVQELRIPYAVPWTQLVVISAIGFAATALATLGPIRRAARTPPAEALRYIE